LNFVENASNDFKKNHTNNPLSNSNIINTNVTKSNNFLGISAFRKKINNDSDNENIDKDRFKNEYYLKKNIDGKEDLNVFKNKNHGKIIFKQKII